MCEGFCTAIDKRAKRMSLTEDTGANSSPESLALGEVLTFFGSVADFAAGVPPERGELTASLASAMGRQAGLPDEECDALYFAARLRNTGALGNEAFAKGEPLNDRAAMMARWDVPSAGARICERVAALPPGTADLVRWQAESWDGTGFPDQLRWTGIPKAANLLHIASDFVSIREPEEALAAIASESGRTYAPEQARTFTMWFHTTGGTIDPSPVPYAALDPGKTVCEEIFNLVSERVDAHNDTPGRAQRIAARAQQVGRELNMSSEELKDLANAALLFAIGELRSVELETVQFDPLARLGIETRARNAIAAAALMAACPALSGAAALVRARAEWYDGTGMPDRLRHGALPRGAQVLAVCIAYEAMDETYRTRITEDRTAPIARIETAGGTQFDPVTVRALVEVLKAHA